MVSRVWLEPPETWEPEIKGYEEEDRRAPPASGAIVFAGSSSIRLWSTLERDMAPLPVLNRGFGGAQTHQILHFAPRILLPYAPSALVLYSGENDLEARTKKTPERVLDEVAALVDLLSGEVPEALVYLLAVKPSPARRTRWALARRLNALFAGFAQADGRCRFVDIATPAFDGRGHRRKDLYLADGLHLSPKGYELWTHLLRPQLLADQQRRCLPSLDGQSPEPPLGRSGDPDDRSIACSEPPADGA
ncbi:MAG: GDSL-type esterase/lipase family protein [Bdellovibrio bacteriovorus]